MPYLKLNKYTQAIESWRGIRDIKTKLNNQMIKSYIIIIYGHFIATKLIQICTNLYIELIQLIQTYTLKNV